MDESTVGGHRRRPPRAYTLACRPGRPGSVMSRVLATGVSISGRAWPTVICSKALARGLPTGWTAGERQGEPAVEHSWNLGIDGTPSPFLACTGVGAGGGSLRAGPNGGGRTISAASLAVRVAAAGPSVISGN